MENDPEIWYEYRLEEFFKELDKQTKKNSRLLDKVIDHPGRDGIIAEEMDWSQLLGIVLI